MFSNDYNVLIGAPTGLAAYNINGLTLHKLFKLPIIDENNKITFDLKEFDLKYFRQIYSNLKLIVIGIVCLNFN